MKTLTLLVINLATITSLNLRAHGIWDNYYASSIAVFRNRAFLALPRSSCFNNFTYPTLIDAHWNSERQTLTAGRRLFYPSEKYQEWGECDQLQDVVSVDVEVKKARLWVLDKGSAQCSPKIVIYNLYTNSEIYVCKLEELSKNFTSLVVDSLGQFGSIGYVGQKDNSELVAFSFNDRKWWTIGVIADNGKARAVPVERLTISLTEPVLYLTSDENTELFGINLTAIRSLDIIGSQTAIRDNQAIFFGDKLGPSGGMAADLLGGLNYYLIRDFAILRWTIGKPLRAEYHDVLWQSYETLPYVPHIFNDPQLNVWALVNPLSPQRCTNLSVMLPEDIPVLNSRVVRLTRFMKKGRKGRRGFVSNTT